MTLAATELSVTYGADTVLSDCSLAVAPGEVVCLIGPSGVGKTTLLRHFGLFREPDGGTVVVDGANAWTIGTDRRRRLRRRLGVVFQRPSLFDGTVAGNAAYGLRVRRTWRARLSDAIRRRLRGTAPDPTVREALDVVGLAERADEPVSSLSGGQAQRLSFARALAFDPDYLLLDEPTSELDPRNTAVIEDAIDAARARDIGVLLATHDMHQARRIADRVAVLLGTDVTEVGPAARVFESPTDERTRQFVDGELVY